MVDDRLVTMQVRIPFRHPLPPLNRRFVSRVDYQQLSIGALADVRMHIPFALALGHSRSRTLPIPRCRILSWS